MRLLNFELEGDVGTIMVRGQGHDWDLHNCANFEGFTFEARADTLLLQWVVVTDAQWGCGTTPWGDASNDARSCGLLFCGLRSFQCEAKKAPIKNPGDATGLTGLSRTVPGQGELGFRGQWNPEDEYHLYFEFDDGRTLEIGADTVELVVDPPGIS